MATFTMELREVLDRTDNIGLNEYPIFDESYREGLNKKIVDHFYYREIGQETVDMFIHFLRRKMNEIMPLYNQLYKSEALALDPFLTFRTTSTTTSEGTSQTESTAQSEGTNAGTTDSTSRTVSSELPQVRLSGDEDYATSAADAVSHVEATGATTGTETATQAGTQAGEATTTAEGFSGPLSRLLLEYRQTFLNIDMMVIEELEPLFMQLWDNGNEFSEVGFPPVSLYPIGWWF